MMNVNNVPMASYGILQQAIEEDAFGDVVEQVRNLGYGILDGGYSAVALKNLSDQFNQTREQYVETHGEATLRSMNEFHTVRSPLTHGGDAFLRLALNKNLIATLSKLIEGKFILNQQNSVVNPPQQTYNQAAWHRDLPYQHFVSTKPLAINALFCIDDFTVENGATFVLPASHKSENFPSSDYIQRNAIQVEAKAGSFIVLDCMLFHAGGFNKTHLERRAVNHIYNIPFFKQQINIPMNLKDINLSVEERDILGFTYPEPVSIADYLSKRVGKKY